MAPVQVGRRAACPLPRSPSLNHTSCCWMSRQTTWYVPQHCPSCRHGQVVCLSFTASYPAGLVFPLLQDIDAVEALIQGLALFNGGVLMVMLFTGTGTCVDDQWSTASSQGASSDSGNITELNHRAVPITVRYRLCFCTV